MKDKTIIVPVLVLYLGLWVFTGTATSSAIAILEKVNASISMLSTPLGTFLLLAGIVILTYVCARNLERILRTIKATTWRSENREGDS
jgi:fumarate reductase subunit D